MRTAVALGSSDRVTEIRRAITILVADLDLDTRSVGSCDVFVALPEDLELAGRRLRGLGVRGLIAVNTPGLRAIFGEHGVRLVEGPPHLSGHEALMEFVLRESAVRQPVAIPEAVTG